MTKCPKCNEEIDSLDVYEKSQTKNVLRLNTEGNTQYGFATSLDWVDSTDFECPLCNATLFDNEKDAKDFLSS